MKPTKEIIELSRKLYYLGFRKDIEYGDWYIQRGETGLLLNSEDIVIPIDQDFISIPSPEDGLEWIKENTQRVELWAQSKKELWPCWIGGHSVTIEKSVWVAVLKAMVKVLENK